MSLLSRSGLSSVLARDNLLAEHIAPGADDIKEALVRLQTTLSGNPILKKGSMHEALSSIEAVIDSEGSLQGTVQEKLQKVLEVLGLILV